MENLPYISPCFSTKSMGILQPFVYPCLNTLSSHTIMITELEVNNFGNS